MTRRRKKRNSKKRAGARAAVPVAVIRRAVFGVDRVWANGELVYDSRARRNRNGDKGK